MGNEGKGEGGGDGGGGVGTGKGTGKSMCTRLSKLPLSKLPFQPINILKSATKKEHKPKLLGPDIFQWGGGLGCERMGAKKFGMSLGTQGNETF